MNPVTVLGAGALGAVIAQAFATAGHPTTVWNRTPARLSALVEQSPSLRTADTVADAIAAGDLIAIAVADVAAARAVIEAAGVALTDRLVVNFTSTTPEESRALAELVGANYLDGAAMSGTRLVGDPSALFLYAGPAATFAAAEPTLRALGAARSVGEDPGASSLWDTALLGLNLGLLTGFYQAAALVGGSAQDVAAVATSYLPFATALITDHAGQIDAGTYPADDGNLTVYAGVVQHLIATATARGVAPDLAESWHALITQAIAQGRGSDGLAALTEALR
ncbi:NAD(P)-binding domain-containing protein [Kribbella sp. DT2]|uniref:imine reductase family protein n=1 Tax=Kribbella sp. DT2 TaxID=3393427 RepID=UPI003CE905E5